ncbi:MAG TPA: hypothetical protein VLE25_10190 [Nitrospira sp.]|nr:hypothetical protein [Nitrospira sp.]
MPPFMAAIAAVSGLVLCAATGVSAIETTPSQDEIRAALDRGVEAAKEHRPPDAFYTRFGATDELHPSGFLITKLAALSVMATHMGLRGVEPTEADIAQALDGKTMLVSATIFGNVPNFAVDSYMVLDQAGKTIKPVTVRFDGQASRSAAWPEPPRFKAKVVASFAYADFDPAAPTTITIFPANGGEVTFPVEFSSIK